MGYRKRADRRGTASRILAWALALMMAFALLPQTEVQAAGAVTLGSAGTPFEAGEYLVPIALKKATNLSEASAAAECPGKYGTLTVSEDGTATLQMDCRSVTVGTATDYAKDFKISPDGTLAENSTAAVAADIVSEAEVETTNGTTSVKKTMPTAIRFAIPEAMKGEDGVYMSMWVDAMGYRPDAYLAIDYASAKKSDDASFNYTTDVSTALVDQFGKYNVTAQVTVTKGKISDVDIEGTGFGGTHAEENEGYLAKAVNGTGSKKGMKEKLIGLYDTDDTAINNLDAVSGATYSSKAIKEAVMGALGIVIETEELPAAELPDDVGSLEAGKTYAVQIKDITDVVAHSVIGKNTAAAGKWDAEKQTAYLTVDKDGDMTISYKFVSGTVAEPLEVLGFNGYYDGYDAKAGTAGTLTKDGVKTLTEKDGDFDVVTSVEMPLGNVSDLKQYYNTNVYLYVDAMKNLGKDKPETLSGVLFDKGKFNIDSKITVYWDSLYKCTADDATEDSFLTTAGSYTFLKDGTYAITGKLKQPNGEKSMADSAVTHTMKLTVKDGAYDLTMNFKGLSVGSLRGYLKDLKYYEEGYTLDKQGNPSGTLADVKADSVQRYTDGTKVSSTLNGTTYTDFPDIVTFRLPAEGLAGKMAMQVFVPLMESISKGTGTKDVFLELDWTSVKAADANDAAFSAEDAVDENPAADKKDDNKSDGNGSSKKDSGSKGDSKGGSTGTAKTLKKGTKYKKGGNTYKALSGNTVSLIKAANKKSVTVPATVKVGGVTASVTAIGNSAFSSAKKKMTSVTIGKNVTTVGKKAFAGCKKLKKITVKSTKLKKVGAKALSGIHKKAVIKVPKKQKKKYTKLFKNKGQKKSVKVK